MPGELVISPEDFARTNADAEETKEGFRRQFEFDQCYLKTQKQNFKQFIIELHGTTVNFLRQNRHTKELDILYTNELEVAHVAFGHKEKCPKTAEIYHAIVLMLPTDKTRVIYFQSQESRQQCYNTMLNA